MDSYNLHPPEVVAVKAHAAEHPAGHIAAQAGAAVDIHRFGFVQLPSPLAQLIHRDVEEPFDVLAICPLGVGAHIQQGDAAIPGREATSSQKKFYTWPEGVFDDIAHKVDRVFGRAERRGVAQLQVAQVGGGHPGADGGCQHITALIHPVEAHNLGAEDAAVPFS